MHYHWAQTAPKKGNATTLKSVHQVKQQCNFYSGCWNNSSAIFIASSESSEPNSCSMLEQSLFRVRGYCIVFTKIKAMSLCLSNFLKTSSLKHLGIRNILSDVYYDDKKHYQVQSDHRRIQNLLKSLTGYAKTLHLRLLNGF